ncbi:hypothetical protein DAI22_12g084550 [Oryza sativa Japonica Group]|nr:hypothetical protein DAI22_12g084550 [Oryza sativa Japonica Group]
MISRDRTPNLLLLKNLHGTPNLNMDKNMDRAPFLCYFCLAIHVSHINSKNHDSGREKTCAPSVGHGNKINKVMPCFIIST